MALAPARSQLKNQHLRSPTSHHPGPRGQPRPRLRPRPRPRPRRREQQRPPSPTRKGIPLLLRRLLFPRRSRLMLVLHVFNLVCPRFKFPVLRVHLSARKWLWAHQWRGLPQKLAVTLRSATRSSTRAATHGPWRVAPSKWLLCLACDCFQRATGICCVWLWILTELAGNFVCISDAWGRCASWASGCRWVATDMTWLRPRRLRPRPQPWFDSIWPLQPKQLISLMKQIFFIFKLCFHAQEILRQHFLQGETKQQVEEVKAGDSVWINSGCNHCLYIPIIWE